MALLHASAYAAEALPSFSSSPAPSPAPSPATPQNSAQTPPAVGCIGPKGFADIVAPLLPAVVNISIIKKVTTFSLEFPPGTGPEGMGNPGGSPLDDLLKFRDFLERQFEVTPKKRRIPVGVGSGFIISPEGHVVTNAHVVEGAHEVVVTLTDQTELKAKVIGVDPRADLALLKISSSKPLPFVQWGDASKVRAGDWAIAIGNPLGLGGTVTLGIISHVGRSFMMQQNSVGGFFQTDASINVGNSGGPLFSFEGKVIGINMMIASSTGGSIGIGFAIPSDVAQFVINQLKEYGRVKRGWIGVQIQPLNQEIAKSLGLKTPQGALVGSVLDDSPAAKAGIQQTDVILKVNGIPVEDSTKLIKVVGGLPIGSKVPLVVWRKNKNKGAYEEITLQITIGEFDDQEEGKEKGQFPSPKLKETGVTVQGLTLQELSSTWRQKYNLAEVISGLLVTKVDPESRAAESFQPGDVLLEVNQQKVVSYKDVEDQVKAGKAAHQSSVLCLIQRQGLPFFVTLSLEPIPEDPKKPAGHATMPRPRIR